MQLIFLFMVIKMFWTYKGWLHNIVNIPKTHWTIHFKMVNRMNFMVHEFYLNKKEINYKLQSHVLKKERHTCSDYTQHTQEKNKSCIHRICRQKFTQKSEAHPYPDTQRDRKRCRACKDTRVEVVEKIVLKDNDINVTKHVSLWINYLISQSDMSQKQI